MSRRHTPKSNKKNKIHTLYLHFVWEVPGTLRFNISTFSLVKFFLEWPGSLSIFSAENGDFYSLRDVNDDAQLFGFALWCAHDDFRGVQEFQSGDLEDV